MRYIIWSEPHANFGRSSDLCIFTKDDQGNESIAAPLVFSDCTNKLIETPTIQGMRRDLDGTAFLQACLDRAWEIGMRPAGYAGMTEHIGAIKAHLDDMRALVFVNKIPALVPPGLVSGSDPLEAYLKRKD